MNDTLTTMEYVYVDLLSPDQLMENDLIEIVDEFGENIVEVKKITAVEGGWLIEATNDFDEVNDYIISDDTKIKLYVLQ